jgi:hypothetical protein
LNALFEAAQEVADFMRARRWKFCVIGGLAVQRWGEPRLTQDADLTLWTGFEDEEPRVDALLARFQARREGAREFALVNRVLLLTAKNGAPVDISLAALPYEADLIARATPFAFAEGIVLPTCSADDLFVLKAFAARPRDWLDAEGIVARQGERLDRGYILSVLKELAEAVYRPEILAAARRILEGNPWRK